MDVLFPAPFGPRNPKIDPLGTRKERLRTATFFPYSLRRSSVWMARFSESSRMLSLITEANSRAKLRWPSLHTL